MENTQHFGSLTPRMQKYRQSVLDTKPYVRSQRALLCTEAYKANQEKPVVLKRALMLKNILEKMDIYIEDESLLAGKSGRVKSRRSGIS